jgi:hypothetical protein
VSEKNNYSNSLTINNYPDRRLEWKYLRMGGAAVLQFRPGPWAFWLALRSPTIHAKEAVKIRIQATTLMIVYPSDIYIYIYIYIYLI